MGSTAAEDYRACLEGVALLGERDLEGAVAILEPLVDTADCPCRVEAAFLLGVVRLTQAVPNGVRRRAAADAFAVAAAGGNPVYSPAAAYRYATLLDTGDHEQLRASWQRVVDTGSRAYSPVAHYAIAQSWRRDGRDDEAEKSMVQAWLSADPEYSPKAAVWLTERFARAGKWDKIAGIGTMINLEYGPFFLHNDFVQREQLASLWRHQLLDNLNPVMVLRATHALAQFDGVTDTPSLQILLRDHIDAQPDGAETSETAEIPEGLEIPASEEHLWRRPWWLGTVAAHHERGTLPELTHDLFWLIDRFYSRIAWPYAENDTEDPLGEDPLGLVRDLVHSVDEFRWGWLLQDSVRQRMNAILGSEVLPPGWPDHDQPDQEEAES
ncbi:MAG: hypothetical protein ACRDUV_20165 [Pseudonocardiaceae bacterium]